MMTPGDQVSGSEGCLIDDRNGIVNRFLADADIVLLGCGYFDAIGDGLELDRQTIEAEDHDLARQTLVLDNGGNRRGTGSMRSEDDVQVRGGSDGIGGNLDFGVLVPVAVLLDDGFAAGGQGIRDTLLAGVTGLVTDGAGHDQGAALGAVERLADVLAEVLAVARLSVWTRAEI